MEVTPRGPTMQHSLQPTAGRRCPRVGRFLGRGIGVLIALMLGATIPSTAMASTSAGRVSSPSSEASAPTTNAVWQHQAVVPNLLAEGADIWS